DATAMWYEYYNLYLNYVRDNDRTLQGLLDAVSALDLWSTTAVVRTADHGELGGSHGGLRGKGPLPYEQETHVPMVILHPQQPAPPRADHRRAVGHPPPHGAGGPPVPPPPQPYRPRADAGGPHQYRRRPARGRAGRPAGPRLQPAAAGARAGPAGGDPRGGAVQ